MASAVITPPLYYMQVGKADPEVVNGDIEVSPILQIKILQFPVLLLLSQTNVLIIK